MKENKTRKILIRVGLVCMIAGTIFLYSCGGGGGGSSTPSTPSGSWGAMVWGTGKWGGP